MAAITKLAAEDLMAVAETGRPPALAEIVDVDLADFPVLPVSHPQHERRKTERKKFMAQNTANAERRRRLTWQDAGSQVTREAAAGYKYHQSRTHDDARLSEVLFRPLPWLDHARHDLLLRKVLATRSASDDERVRKCKRCGWCRRVHWLPLPQPGQRCWRSGSPCRPPFP